MSNSGLFLLEIVQNTLFLFTLDNVAKLIDKSQEILGF